MKKLCLFLFCWMILLPTTGLAEGDAALRAALWSKSEKYFVLRYSNSFDTGDYERLEVFRVVPEQGKMIEAYESQEVGSEKNSSVLPIKNEFSKIRKKLVPSPTHWITKDSHPHRSSEFPCRWPPRGGNQYQSKITLKGRKGILLLKTFGQSSSAVDSNGEESGYQLSIRMEDEATPRILSTWHRPQEDGGFLPASPNVAQAGVNQGNTGWFFGLGAVGLSPSGKWMVVLLRRFDYGFECPDTVPMPLFFRVDGSVVRK